jgi:hypothetical protein
MLRYLSSTSKAFLARGRDWLKDPHVPFSIHFWYIDLANVNIDKHRQTCASCPRLTTLRPSTACTSPWPAGAVVPQGKSGSSSCYATPLIRTTGPLGLRLVLFVSGEGAPIIWSNRRCCCEPKKAIVTHMTVTHEDLQKGCANPLVWYSELNPR